MDKKTKSALSLLKDELHRIKKKPEFNSVHEGYAVLLEEVDELWEEVRKKPGARAKDLLRGEAVQVAAMAVRFIADLT